MQITEQPLQHSTHRPQPHTCGRGGWGGAGPEGTGCVDHSLGIRGGAGSPDPGAVPGGSSPIAPNLGPQQGAPPPGPVSGHCSGLSCPPPSPQHFVCAKCEKPFRGHRHYERKGLAYCETHYSQVRRPQGADLEGRPALGLGLGGRAGRLLEGCGSDPRPSLPVLTREAAPAARPVPCAIPSRSRYARLAAGCSDEKPGHTFRTAEEPKGIGVPPRGNSVGPGVPSPEAGGCILAGGPRAPGGG